MDKFLHAITAILNLTNLMVHIWLMDLSMNMYIFVKYSFF